MQIAWLPADWLDRIFALAPEDGAGVLGAHYLLPEDSSWVGRTWHRYQEAPKSGEVSHVPAGDLVMRREDFLKLGGFDETIQTNEDYELCDRARKAGMNVRAFPQIGVVHLGTAQSLRVFFRKQAWHGTHVIKVFLRDRSEVAQSQSCVLCCLHFVQPVGCSGRNLVWALAIARPLVIALRLASLRYACRRLCSLPSRCLTSRRYSDFFPLFALYLTYGIARAKALLSIKNFI